MNVTETERQQLREAQARLVRALSRRGAEAPVGLDPSRLDLTAQLLAHKRERIVARAWPNLAAAMGPAAFRWRFDEYAQKHPLLQTGAQDDGMAFMRYLSATDVLPDAGRLEWLHARLRRTWFAIAYLRQSRKLAVGFRLPRGGRRIVQMRTRLSWRSAALSS